MQNVSIISIVEKNGSFDVFAQVNTPAGANSWAISHVTLYRGSDKRAAWEAAKAVSAVRIQYRAGYYGRPRTVRA